jgi:hypothetical protein
MARRVRRLADWRDQMLARERVAHRKILVLLRQAGGPVSVQGLINEMEDWERLTPRPKCVLAAAQTLVERGHARRLRGDLFEAVGR